MKPLILASGSPRRAELLTQMGLEFTVLSVPIDESAFAHDDPAECAQMIATAKAEASRATHTLDDAWILAADTIVYANGRAMGKPTDRNDARIMLSLLSGRRHTVVTGIALVVPREPRPHTTSCTTEVEFAPLTDDEITWYLDSDEWRGVAGAYRIQGKAACFIHNLSGSYSNVVGLPIHTLYSILTAYYYPVCIDR